MQTSKIGFFFLNTKICFRQNILLLAFNNIGERISHVGLQMSDDWNGIIPSRATHLEGRTLAPWLSKSVVVLTATSPWETAYDSMDLPARLTWLTATSRPLVRRAWTIRWPSSWRPLSWSMVWPTRLKGVLPPPKPVEVPGKLGSAPLPTSSWTAFSVTSKFSLEHPANKR